MALESKLDISDDLGKRKRDMDDHDSLKKTKPEDESGSGTETMEIAPEKVGQIIGSKGAIIADMQNRSGCKIYVNQDFPPGGLS
jgi:polyribonucleotide nucleotidyltransferase